MILDILTQLIQTGDVNTLFISNNNKVGKVKLKKVENRKCVLNPNRIKDKQLFLKAKLNVDDNLLLINLIPSIF